MAPRDTHFEQPGRPAQTCEQTGPSRPAGEAPAAPGSRWRAARDRIVRAERRLSDSLWGDLLAGLCIAILCIAALFAPLFFAP